MLNENVGFMGLLGKQWDDSILELFRPVPFVKELMKLEFVDSISTCLLMAK